VFVLGFFMPLVGLADFTAAKDHQRRTLRLNQVTQNIKLTGNWRSYVAEIRDILQELDDCGQLGTLLEAECMMGGDHNNQKTEGASSRADRINQRLNNPKFLTYSKARSVSFARKLTQLQVNSLVYLVLRGGEMVFDVLGICLYTVLGMGHDSFAFGLQIKPNVHGSAGFPNL
jgi:hypothetical protein